MVAQKSSLPHLAKLLSSSLLCVFLVLVLFIGCSPSTSFVAYTYEKAVVTRVIDGDTIEIEGGERVRYLGIDTPEIAYDSQPTQPFGIEATNRNKELVEGKTVYLQKGTRNVDEYGRLLRYVYTDDGTFVNAELVAEGLAKAYIFDTNDWYSQTLVQLDQYARMKKVGLWAE